jgi:hypothetical protein
MRPYLKNKLQQQKDWGMAQVVECLPRNHKVLHSIPNATKKKARKLRKGEGDGRRDIRKSNKHFRYDQKTLYRCMEISH